MPEDECATETTLAIRAATASRYESPSCQTRRCSFGLELELAGTFRLDGKARINGITRNGICGGLFCCGLRREARV